MRTKQALYWKTESQVQQKATYWQCTIHQGECMCQIIATTLNKNNFNVGHITTMYTTSDRTIRLQNKQSKTVCIVSGSGRLVCSESSNDLLQTFPRTSKWIIVGCCCCFSSMELSSQCLHLVYSCVCWYTTVIWSTPLCSVSRGYLLIVGQCTRCK